MVYKKTITHYAGKKKARPECVAWFNTRGVVKNELRARWCHGIPRPYTKRESEKDEGALAAAWGRAEPDIPKYW